MIIVGILSYYLIAKNFFSNMGEGILLLMLLLWLFIYLGAVMLEHYLKNKE